MNPLGIKPERFTVAEDDQGSLLGFGQLEPKEGCVELRSMVVDAAHRLVDTLPICVNIITHTKEPSALFSVTARMHTLVPFMHVTEGECS